VWGTEGKVESDTWYRRNRRVKRHKHSAVQRFCRVNVTDVHCAMYLVDGDMARLESARFRMAGHHYRMPHASQFAVQNVYSLLIATVTLMRYDAESYLTAT
jgi:hypothetical protein